MARGFVSIAVLVIGLLIIGAGTFFFATQKSAREIPVESKKSDTNISREVQSPPAQTGVQAASAQPSAPNANHSVQTKNQELQAAQPKEEINTHAPNTRLASLEQEIAILFNDAQPIGPDHFARLSNELTAQANAGANPTLTQKLRTMLETVNPNKIPSASAPTAASSAQTACVSNTKPVFTRHITDMSKVNYVVPPPTIGAGPSLKTHGYIGTDHVRVPVYAPVDMVLNTGAHFEGGPYWLGFEVSCEVTVRIGHITEPIQAIVDIFPSALASDSRDQPIKNKIPFTAGDLIGYTTGTAAAGNWDMGVYDSTTSNKYKDNATWGNSWVYTSAVCPFDYFEASLKSDYTSKFSSVAMAGNIRDGAPFCQ